MARCAVLKNTILPEDQREGYESAGLSAQPSTVTGYAHRSYVESLAEFGEPLELPLSRGWLLSRPVGPPAFAQPLHVGRPNLGD
jgi:hypothetical protein